MRKLIVANWKMHHGVTETLRYLMRLANTSEYSSTLDIVVAPPATNLYSAGIALQDSFVKLAAQNCFWEDSGAYTGEVSPMVLKELGCEFVILGHSERRQLFGETSEQVGQKVKAVLVNGMRPILCVGETQAERESGKMFPVLEEQLRLGLQAVERDEVGRLVIAYEPVWAIGTGKNAQPAEAQEVHQQLRKRLAANFRLGRADEIPIIYGGSVGEENIVSMMVQPDINGALVGGASLEVDELVGLLRQVFEST